MKNRLSITALAEIIAESTGRSKKSAEEFIREFFKLTSEVLVVEDKLRIKGFGSFKVSTMEARESVDVSTGEPTEIVAHKRVIFTPTQELASIVNAPFEIFQSVEIDNNSESSLPVEENDEDSDQFNKDIDHNEDDQTPSLNTDDIYQDYDISESRSEEMNEGEEDVVEYPILEAGSEEEDLDDEITLEAYKRETQNEIVYGPPEIPVSLPVPSRKWEDFPETADDDDDIQRYEITFLESRRKVAFGKKLLIITIVILIVTLIIYLIGCMLNWWPNFFIRYNKIKF